MSTAIMHQSALYDFGELLMKNQSHPVHAVQMSQLPPIAHSQSPGEREAAAAAAAAAWAAAAGGDRAALARAQSLPAPPSLAGLLDRIGRRRLERTQSEPTPQQQPQQQPPPPAASRYKTELCRPFEEAGACKYGDKCQFAHGMNELRNLQRHPKYKTELCRTYHSVGFCPYGPRCHFVHNFDEVRRKEPASPGGSASASSSGARSPAEPASPTFAFAPPPPPRSERSERSDRSERSSASSRPSSPPDDARLPVFNRISSTIASFGDLILA